MPKDILPSRWFSYYGAVLFKPVWLCVLVVWSLLLNADAIFNNILKPHLAEHQVAKWRWVYVVGEWPWFIWALGVLVILLGGVSHNGYRLYMAMRSRHEAVASELEDHLAPKLSITASSDGPDRDAFQIEDDRLKARRVRVKLQNVSGRTIDDTNVRLLRMEPSPPSLRGVPPLRLLFSNWEPTTLHPGQPVMVDVFYKIASEQKITITHDVNQLGTGISFPAREQRTFWLEATGRNCPPTEVKLILRVEDDGLIALSQETEDR